ncbi:MAG: enoyl-CoA hydratase-related protein [Thermomicrobiales bacterium]
MSDLVQYERRHDAVWLTMNRPQVRNALSREHITAIRSAMERAANDEGARAIVLAGADPVFCAGADINQYREVSDRNQVMKDGALLRDLLDYMMRCPLPIVARVQRAAFGGAMGLISASDVAIAAEGTRFSLSEARLGIVPAVISEAVLAALGPRNARQLMLRSEPFGTDEALKIGLIQEVVAGDELDGAVEEVIDQFRAGAPGALARIKTLLYTLTQSNVGPEGKRSMILELAADRRESDEGQEGLRSFIEKRKPAWAEPEQEPGT